MDCVKLSSSTLVYSNNTHVLVITQTFSGLILLDKSNIDGRLFGSLFKQSFMSGFNTSASPVTSSKYC